MVELKPCPFCGNIPSTKVRYSKVESGSMILIAYVECECKVNKSVMFEGYGKQFEDYKAAFNIAIENWNRRADNDQRR